MKDLSVIIAAIIAFAVTLFSGYFVIPYLRKLKFGQTILEEGPNWHKQKQGTPTMGGIMMVAGVLLSLTMGFGFSYMSKGDFANEMLDAYHLTILLAGVIMSLCMCAIGFFDKIFGHVWGEENLLF